MVCVQSAVCMCLPSKQNIHGDTNTSKTMYFVVRKFGTAMLSHLPTQNLGKAGQGWSLLKLGTAGACLRDVGWWGLCWWCGCGTAGGAAPSSPATTATAAWPHQLLAAELITTMGSPPEMAPVLIPMERLCTWRSWCANKDVPVHMGWSSGLCHTAHLPQLQDRPSWVTAS